MIGVIGTYNSGCAAVEIPVLNKAPGGGLAMVSPGNTFVCLTEPGSICKPNEPDVYYPSGKRNYIRVVPNDAVQMAGLATFANGHGIRNPYILVAADDPTSKGQADTFEGAARSLGMNIAGVDQWDPKAKSYSDLMQKVKASGADAVLLAGLLEQNGAQIIKDKVSVLGPNDGPVKLLAPDGFAQQSTIDQAGAATKGMYASLPGKVPRSLTGEGSAFVKELKSQIGDQPLELFAPYAGQAAEVLMPAIQSGERDPLGGDRLALPDPRPRRHRRQLLDLAERRSEPGADQRLPGGGHLRALQDDHAAAAAGQRRSRPVGGRLRRSAPYAGVIRSSGRRSLSSSSNS